MLSVVSALGRLGLGWMDTTKMSIAGIGVSAHGLDIPWAAVFSSSFGLSKKEAHFMLMAILSVPNGLVWGLMPRGAARHLYSLLSGLLMMFAVFGIDSLEVYIPALVVYAIMLAAPRHAGLASYFVAFPYLIWMHTVHGSGDAWRKGDLDYTAVMMLVALKVVSMAQNYSDGVKMGAEKAARHPRALTRCPTALEMLGFVTMAHSNLVGPAQEVKMYLQFCDGEGEYAARPKRGGDVWTQARYFLGTLARFVLFLAVYVHFNDVFSLDTITGGASQVMTATHATRFGSWAPFSQWWLPTKTWYGDMYILLNVQSKYYALWSLCELGMVLAGISLRVDDNGDGHWDRFRNFEAWKLNTASSPNRMPLFWNVGTGNWLRFYVYERILLDAGGRPTPLSLLVTQMVSALWHGLSPGYLWFFFTTALFFESGKTIYRYQRASKSPAVQMALQAANYVMCHIMMGQAGPAFMALTPAHTWRIIKEFYGSAQILCMVIIIVGMVAPPAREPKANAGVVGGKAAGRDGAKDGLRDGARAAVLDGKSADGAVQGKAGKTE